jgi:hypothetical protein
MDGHRDLEEIDRLTQIYLDIPQVKADLKRVGEEIAREYLSALATESRPASVQKLLQLQPSVQSSDAQSFEVQPSERPQTPQRQLNHLPSLHTQSSEGTFGLDLGLESWRHSTEVQPVLQWSRHRHHPKGLAIPHRKPLPSQSLVRMGTRNRKWIHFVE